MSDHIQQNSEYIGQDDCENSPDVESEQPKRKSIIKRIILPAIVLLLIVAVVTGVLTYYNAPAMKISKAFEKTLFDSSKISIDGELSNGMGLVGNIEFGKGIKGSTLDLRIISTKGKEVKLSIQDGIVYAEERQVSDVFELLEKLKGESKEDQLTVALIEMLDKSIDGKLDKEKIEEFVKNELPALVNNDNAQEAPDSETIEKTIESIIKKSIKEEAIVIEPESTKNGKVYDIRADVSDVIDCAFELSEKDDDVEALIQYIVSTNEQFESKEELKDTLDEMESLKSAKLRFSVTVKSGRVIGIEIKDTIKLDIDSTK